MFKKPKVSCIIPTYNRAFYVKQAVDSVFSQRFESFELIVIDDGSEDETSSIMKEYRSKLLYIAQGHKGVSAARNAGYALARGEYIAYLDSDDLWRPWKLSIQCNFLDRNPDYPLCYTDEIWYRNGKRVNQGRRHRKYSGNIFKKCLPLCIISPSSAMMPKRLLEQFGGFDENMPAAEDYDLWLRMSACYPIYFIPLPLMVKRGGHADQLSKKVMNIDKYRIEAILKILQNRTLISAYRNAAFSVLVNKCALYSQGCKKRGRIEEAEYYEKLALDINNDSQYGKYASMLNKKHTFFHDSDYE